MIACAVIGNLPATDRCRLLDDPCRCTSRLPPVSVHGLAGTVAGSRVLFLTRSKVRRGIPAHRGERQGDGTLWFVAMVAEVTLQLPISPLPDGVGGGTGYR